MTRLPEPLEPAGRTRVRWRGRVLDYYGGCDYFRLSSEPRVLAALRRALKRYGLGVSASRLTTGNHELYEQLERRLAEFFGVERAVLAPNGWAPNLMVAQALAGRFAHVLLDERAHGCLVDAARLLEGKVRRFRHRDPTDLERQLKRVGKNRVIVLTDGMFSQDGTMAPLKECLRRLPPSAMVLVDDAHGGGVLGRRGRGTPEEAGVASARIIQTVTLSKAFGSYGGAVLGTERIGAAVVRRSRAFVGSTPLPLPLAGAALAAVEILSRDGNRRTRLWRNVHSVKGALREVGFKLANAPGPIISFAPRNAKEAEGWSRRLLRAGIHPPLIHYPGGARGGYFRFAISSEHEAGQLGRLVAVLSKSERDRARDSS